MKKTTLLDSVRLRYQREKRLHRLRALRAPQTIVRNEERLLTNIEQRLVSLGVDDVFYERLREELWLLFEDHELSCERMGRCLVYLRHRVHAPARPTCPLGHDDCYACSDFEEATEEQQVHFWSAQPGSS